jgi:hypothetical protein
MRIALLPLDDRPVNGRLPAMVAAIAGAELLMPPVELLPRMREPSDPTRSACGRNRPPPSATLSSFRWT